MTTLVVVLSICLQLSAAAWAIRLIRLTGKRTAWMLISTALLLMAVRRIISFVVLLSSGSTPSTVLNEVVGLAISVLMFIGVILIGAYFRHSQMAELEIREREHLFRPGEEKPYQVYTTFTDISALKEAEEENRNLNAQLEDRVKQRTAELEFTNQELEAFTYSISHDLQAPVRAIDGFSQALAERCRDQLSPDGKRYLEYLKASAGKMQDLLGALLTLSRTGRSPVRKVHVEPATLVREVLEVLQPELTGRAVDFQIDPLPPFEGDPTLMKQVYHNLLSNAVKFTARCDRAKIQTGCTGTGPRRVYFVRDNGVGFDPAQAERLFGVFQRLHRDEDFKGTGVGLAITQRIIRRHGGWIWAEARVGHGATFFFHLHTAVPAAEVAA
jgi:signal transduction histidine kinase